MQQRLSCVRVCRFLPFACVASLDFSVFAMLCKVHTSSQVDAGSDEPAPALWQPVSLLDKKPLCQAVTQKRGRRGSLCTSSILRSQQIKALASTMKVAVIGAGASGLVAAKYLSDQGHSVVVFEASDAVGGTFVNKVYDDTCLVSSKYLTAFSDFRMGASVPDHPTAAQYVQYLQSYKEKFLDTSSRVEFRFQTRVVSVEISAKVPQDEFGQGKYSVLSSSGLSEIEEPFGALAVCSGLHNVPKVPTEEEVPGITEFAADTKTICVHSSEYKDRSIFQNRNVLILGCGETAMDITKRAVLGGAKDIGIVVREGFLSIPHLMAEDKPLDVFITNLFEHSYEHPWVHFLQLRWKLSTLVIRAGLFLVGGSSWGFGQWSCRANEVKRGFHIINKSHAALPHINKGQLLKAKRQGKTDGVLGRLWAWFWGVMEQRGVMTLGIADLHDKREVPAENRVKPVTPYNSQVSRISKEAGGPGYRVEFRSGECMENVDVIVMATGYKQEFPFLRRYREQLDEQGAVPRSEEKKERGEQGGCGGCFRHSAGDAYLPNEHFVVDSRDAGVAFIGFARPNVGAIPPQSEMQVQWWLMRAGLMANKPTLEGQASPTVKEAALGVQFKAPDDTQFVRAWMTAHNGRTAEVNLLQEAGASLSRGFSNLLHFNRRNIPRQIKRSEQAKPTADATPPTEANPAVSQTSVPSMNGAQSGTALPERSYLLLGRKYRYGVDYGNYMHRLAEDIGSAPVLSEMFFDMLRGRRPAADTLKAIFAYCFGQAYPSFFRLRGPFASEEQWQVATTELYRVNVDRGFLENFGLVSVSSLFLALNLGFWSLEALAWAVGMVPVRRGFDRYS